MGTGSKRLGRYRLIAEIGHGGMAEVYLALLEGDLGFSYLETIPDRAPARELGGLITRHFAEDRARLQRRLEAELRENPAGGWGVPRFRAAEPILDEPSSDPAVPGQSSRRSRTHPDTGASLPGVTRPSAPRPLGRLRLAVAAAFVASVLAASAALWVPWRARTAAELAPPIVAIATIATPLPAPPAPRRVVLRVRASPPEARILLDGTALDGNPFAGVLVADSEPHEIRIEAPRHVARRERLSLDQDSTLEIVLTADPEAVAPPRAAPTVRVPRAPPRASPVANGDHGKRSLDGVNPYER